MKAKFLGRALSSIVVISLLLSSFAGCGSKSDGKTESAPAETQGTAAAATNTLPIVTKPLTLKLYRPVGSNTIKIISDWGENEAYKELEKRTGIRIQFVSPPVGQESEQYKLMIASGDLPDMIENGSYSSYPGGADKAIDDKVFLKLNEYIDKYAPNFKKVRENDKDIQRLTITDSGNIWAFPCIQTMDELPWNGPILRKDWLGDLGLKMPETISDWYTMLKNFKDKKGVQAPFILPKSGADGYFAIIGAYGVGPKFTMKDGKVVFGPLEPGYKEYVTEMNKWYTEGLIDKDFMTRDGKTQDSMVLSEKAGAWVSSYGTGLDAYMVAKKGDPKFQVEGAPYPSLKAGEQPHLRQRNEKIKGNYTSITKACKNPVEAVKWLDYGYTQEGFLLYNYGIEGLSYTMVNGKPQFTDLLIKNPDGLSYDVVREKYKVHQTSSLRDWRAYKPFSDEQERSMANWNKAISDYVLPSTNMTVEEASKDTSIMSEINAYVDQMLLKFIMGQEPLSKFDEFVKQIKKMNIDEDIAIRQKALDRYNKR